MDSQVPTRWNVMAPRKYRRRWNHDLSGEQMGANGDGRDLVHAPDPARMVALN